MPITASQLVVEVKGDIRDVDQKLDTVDRKTGGLGSKFGGLATAAVAAGGAMAVGFGVKAVMAASSVEESLSKVNTIFGQSGKDIDNWAKGAATNFGLSRVAALTAAGDFGNMFTQLGIGTKEAGKMSTGITELAADFASFHNADISEVITAQSAAFRGEYDSLQRFLPLINAATVEQKAMEMSGKGNAKALTAQEKALAVHALMLSGAGKAAGDFDRTSGSLANRMRIMRGQAENFAATVGTALLPIIIKGLEAFGDLTSTLKEALAPAFRAVVEAVRPVIGQIGDFIDRFELVKPLMGAVAGILGGVFLIAIKAATVALIAFLAPMAAAAAPFILAGAAIGGLVAALVYAWNNFEGFRDVVQTVIDFVTGTIAPLIEQFAGNLKEWMSDAVGWVVKIWPQVSEAIGHVFNVIKTLVTVVLLPVLAVIVGVWRSVGDDVMNIVKTAFRVVGEVINSVLDVIRGVVQFVLAIINGDWSKAWNAALGIVRGIWDLIFGLVRGAGEVIQSILGGFVSLIGNAIEAAFKAGVSVLTSLPGWIIGAVGDVAGAVIGIGRNVVEGIWNGINAAKGWLIQKLKDFIGDAIPGPIKSVLSIFSPSKVTAGLGREVARGLALGMERSQGLVAAAATGLGTAAIPGVSSPGFGLGGAGGIQLSIVVHGAGSPAEAAGAVRDAGLDLVDQLVRELRSR